MHKVFVYGTLMTGRWNAIVMKLLQGRLVASGDVFIEDHMLFIQQYGEVKLPFILANPEAKVYGELYNVPELDQLDEFEKGYERVEVDVHLGTGGTVRAWVYRRAGMPYGRCYPVLTGRYTGKE